MIDNGPRTARRRMGIVAALAVLALALVPSTGWADPGGEPTTPSAKSQPVPSKGKLQLKHKPLAKAKHQTKGGGVSAQTSLAEPGQDLSTFLPPTARDSVTGDFLEKGYDQWARVEGNSTGVYLNIYDPPDRGGDLLQSTATDLRPPPNTLGTPMWSPYGNINDETCENCFQALDNQWHLATVLLAWDPDTQILWMSGTTGSGWNRDDPDPYQNHLYGVSPGCATSNCARVAVDLPSTWQDTGNSNFRAVGTTALAAATVDGFTTVAVGLSDYGVQVYQATLTGDMSLIGTYTRMGLNGIDQTPATAMALDESGLLTMGITNYGNDAYFAQVSTPGNGPATVTDLGYWSKQGATTDANTWVNPISAAIGTRPDGTKVAAFGMTDGKLYLVSVSPQTPGGAVSQLAISPWVGPITSITPLLRTDGSATTDYAIAIQGGSVLSGTGMFLTDPGGPGATLQRQPVTIDNDNDQLFSLPTWADYQSWFPGYKQGRFTIQNTLGQPISVSLQSSPNSGKGCWFAPAWPASLLDASAQFPSSALTLAPGQTTGVYSMGAYTAGPDGGCSGVAGSSGVDNSTAWRGYLVITPANRPAETRIVDVHLVHDGWTVDTSDQKGGSLSVTATLDPDLNSTAFGGWAFVVGDAGAPVASGSAPSLTGYQLTPTDPTTPSVYRLDVGATTWTVPGLGASPAQVQALIPPLQVQGRSGATGAWVNVGQLLPNGSLGVSGSTVTVPGASFFWENASGGPTYTQFQVVTGGSNVLTSATVDLTKLAFCYTGAAAGGPCKAPPGVNSLSFQGTPGTQRVAATGLDQAQLNTSVGLSAGGSLASGDDAYNKVFYRTGSVTGALVTNLYRQDIACAPDCWTSYVGVQPSAGAYLSSGASSVGAKRGVCGASGVNADYLSLAAANANPPSVVGVLLLAGTVRNGLLKTSPVTIQPYSIDPALVAANTATGPNIRNGFGLSGCSGETNSSSSCVIAPTSSARAALYSVGGPYAPGAADTGLRVGALFNNQAQNSVQDMPLTWTPATAQKLNSPANLTSVNSPTYLWKLKNSSALNTPQTDTWVVTHGDLVSETMCTTGTSCQSSQRVSRRPKR